MGSSLHKPYLEVEVSLRLQRRDHVVGFGKLTAHILQLSLDLIVLLKINGCVNVLVFCLHPEKHRRRWSRESVQLEPKQAVAV